MVNVVVKGLPINMKYAELVSLVRKHSEFSFAKQLHSDTISKTAKLIVLSMKSDDARKFRRALDGYVVDYNGDNYPLTCRVAKTNVSEERRSRSRSRSVETIEEENSYIERYWLEPVISINEIVDDIKAIDLRIDIVRQQRILIEEEVNLLLEQQKLLLKKNKLSNPENGSEQPIQLAKPRSRIKGPKLRSLMTVLRVIVFEVLKLIKKHTNYENIYVIKYMVRTTVKRRLLEILHRKVYMTPEELKRLYRMKHPKHTDEALVIKVVSRYRPRSMYNNLIAECKVTSVMDPDEVVDVDMENDLDDWTEDLKKPKIKEENGFSIKEEANDDVVIVEVPKVEVTHIKVEEDKEFKVEAHKEVKQEYREITVEDEDVTIIDDNKDETIIIIDDN